MKTEIEFESHELTVIRVRRSQTVTAFCALCEKKVRHLSVARAAAVLRLSETAVFRLVESGAVHSMETASGRLYLCGNSVSELGKGIRVTESEK